jgi:hypothetical protein
MENGLRIRTCSVRSLFNAGSLLAVTKELSKYNLDVVRKQVRWDRDGKETAGE